MPFLEAVGVFPTWEERAEALAMQEAMTRLKQVIHDSNIRKAFGDWIPLIFIPRDELMADLITARMRLKRKSADELEREDYIEIFYSLVRLNQQAV